jgi:hypothetical protein
MKSLMLLNARRRRRVRRRKNAVLPTRKTSTKTTYGFRPDKSPSRKGSRRRRRLAISVTRSRSGARATVQARKIYVSGRGKRRLIVATNPRRRRSYRSNPLGGNLMNQVKGVFSKENLTVAGGVIAGTALTKAALAGKLGFTLPTPVDPNTAKYVRLAYSIGIPVVGAMLTKRFSPAAAKGMVYSGLVTGITQAIKEFAPEVSTTLGLGEYLDYTPMSAIGAPPPGYMASTRFANVPVANARTRPMGGALNNASAFPSDAWNHQ